MRFNHLALSVSDLERSRRFYMNVLGINGKIRHVEDGLLLDTSEGFTLALLQGEPPRERERFHFGFSQPSADAVRNWRERLLAAGVREISWEDVEEYVSTKVLDPDGYIVELGWEPR